MISIRRTYMPIAFLQEHPMHMVSLAIHLIVFTIQPIWLILIFTLQIEMVSLSVYHYIRNIIYQRIIMISKSFVNIQV